MFECNIRELLPSEWTQDVWSYYKTDQIAADIISGVGILTPLTVAELDHSRSSTQFFLNAAERLGFNTKHSKYLIDLGHHRFAAALKTKTEKVKITVVPFDHKFEMKRFDMQESLTFWLSQKRAPIPVELVQFLHSER